MDGARFRLSAWQRAVLIALVAATALPAAEARSAVDLPGVYTVRMTRALFARDYDTLWQYLHPAYQRTVPHSTWTKCEKTRAAASAGVVIRSVKLATIRNLPSQLPLLGLTRVESVTVQVLYRQRGSHVDQVTVENAYWVKSGGTWRAVWTTPVFAAYKNGSCMPQALY